MLKATRICFTVRRSLCSYKSKEHDIISKIIRVDHAGELAADRIYAAQMAVLGKTSVGPVIQHMWDQEKHHLKTFEELIPRYRVRPTAMLPIWDVVSYALGAGTALLGTEAAMACTVAVEECITEHYNEQIRTLVALNPEKYKHLLEVISKIRDEEMEHHNTGLEHDAEKTPFYSLIKSTIIAGSKSAIWISERI